MIKNKTWAMLSEKEIREEAKITDKEKSAVDAFVKAAKELPKGLVIGISDFKDRDDGITVSKRITSGMTQVVARVRKKSLIF